MYSKTPFYRALLHCVPQFTGPYPLPPKNFPVNFHRITGSCAKAHNGLNVTCEPLLLITSCYSVITCLKLPCQGIPVLYTSLPCNPLVHFAYVSCYALHTAKVFDDHSDSKPNINVTEGSVFKLILSRTCKSKESIN
jgi:hypothetical protein